MYTVRGTVILDSLIGSMSGGLITSLSRMVMVVGTKIVVVPAIPAIGFGTRGKRLPCIEAGGKPGPCRIRGNPKGLLKGVKNGYVGIC